MTCRTSNPRQGRAVSHNTGTGSQSSSHRARVSNGRDLLPNVDGRSLIARRYPDTMSATAVDQGGVDRLSETRPSNGVFAP
jgi:hypothetical protein